MKNKHRGILYLALGEEFDKLTAATALFSRRFTNLPICVISNLERRNALWEKVENVSFRYTSLPSNENRRVKVSLIDYTPFEETLYMDSDAVIQNYGIKSLFSCLKDFDVACQFFGVLEEKDSKQDFNKRTYGKLATILKEEYPITLFGEAALLFRRTLWTKKFFDLWKDYWTRMGCGRDMPAFSFVVKHLSQSVKVFRTQIKFCINTENEDFFIQHKGFEGFEKKFGLPDYIDWNPKL